jgi:hypothetical protein
VKFAVHLCVLSRHSVEIMWVWMYSYCGNTGCGVFKGGIQNYKGFWLKINCSQMKLPNLVNWSSDELSKSAKIWLSKSIFYVKNHQNLSEFFFNWRITNLGAHFLLLTFFDNINFLVTLFSIMMPNFWQLAITPIIKIW